MRPSKRKRLTVWGTDSYNHLVSNYAQERYPDTWRTMDAAQLRMEYAQKLANEKIVIDDKIKRYDLV